MEVPVQQLNRTTFLEFTTTFVDFNCCFLSEINMALIRDLCHSINQQCVSVFLGIFYKNAVKNQAVLTSIEKKCVKIYKYLFYSMFHKAEQKLVGPYTVKSYF